METYLTFMLIRFAVLAAAIAVVAVILFALAVRLKRRGQWDATRERIGPAVSRAADAYARRSQRTGRSSWTASAARAAADRLTSGRGDHR